MSVLDRAPAVLFSKEVGVYATVLLCVHPRGSNFYYVLRAFFLYQRDPFVVFKSYPQCTALGALHGIA